MEFPPGFTSPLMDSGLVTISESFKNSSPTESRPSSVNSDADSLIGDNQPRLLRKSQPRSRNGCWTCRQRKVKCDEIRPKCSPCTRLHKECGWGHRWRFDNLGIHTQRRNKHVSTSGCPSWDEEAQAAASGRQVQLRNSNILPEFTELDNEDDREKKALTRPPGTFNVILTPDSFSGLPEYGGLIRRYCSGSINSWQLSIGKLTEDPNLVILTEFQDTPYFTGTPDKRPSIVNLVAQVSYVPSITYDITNHGHGDVEVFVQHYQDVVSKQIMPLAKRLRLDSSNGNEDIVVRESRTFKPVSGPFLAVGRMDLVLTNPVKLHHAICAITMLSLALKGQRQYLAGSLQHYHQSLSLTITCTSTPSGSLLYLHFILLLYDICCATANCAPDGGMWAQHLQHLARLAFSHDAQEYNVLQAYLLWYTLYLDSQSCLAGNSEAGSYVRAYQMQGSILPSWRQSKNMPQDEVMLAIFNLNKYMCNKFSELSQMAVRIREDVEHGRGSIAHHQRCILEFKNDLCTAWALKYPLFLSKDLAQASNELPIWTRTSFEFAAFQYSMAMVYLHTSMYPQQRMHVSSLQHKEITAHCRNIFAMANSVIAAKRFDQHHIILPIFLAGFASVEERDKNRALGLIFAMEGTGISNNASRSRQLLEAVFDEQRRRVQCGGSAGEVDWISLARQRGIKIVNMGL